VTAVVTCASCGNGLRESARFCDACGVPAGGAVDTAEYKQVTVLFADVVRSMHLAAALDAERFREIMTEIIERAATVVHRYGGTVEHTGDGVMALFGAPLAMEDHAFRACLAALAIQEDANLLAADVRRRDGVALQLRVGLNSGRVIAGDMGSGSLGYGATGEAVGYARRMESAAPPGEVLLSESTARLVEQAATLAEPEWVRIKGTEEPVQARRLSAIGQRRDGVGRAESRLIGRGWEMAALEAIVERAINSRGGVVNVVGPAGIGKSRSARETAALASSRGAEVNWAFCESHASDIPFHAVARLLRESTGLTALDAKAARAQLRAILPGADPEDLLLFDDLLGVADGDVPLPPIDPDARRRRLTALINTATLAHTEPALFIIEDAHWIDAVSESMLAEFLAIIPRTPLMVLITSRPEYDGALSRVPGAQTIALGPLGDSDTRVLLAELLGSDPSLNELTAVIADRAAGSPFFAEEMVREFVQGGVLTGEHGDYVCRTNVAEVSVPATVQAAIEARIDRLTAPAKRTLNAASVVGAHFGADLLAALGLDPVFDELLGVELIDQVRFTPSPMYAFHHPLIRTVAYESQLTSDRGEWHRRLAVAIQDRGPDSVEDNAALVAEHLEAAGELSAAYGWHMRAAAWSADRDLGAARLSWERARRIADRLPDDPGQLSMRIAATTMLCATDWQSRADKTSRSRFAELREMCSAAGDNVSLAIGMTGAAVELLYSGRSQGAPLVSEQMALLEKIGDPTLTVGLAPPAFASWFSAGDFGELMRWTQTVIDLADGDPGKGAGFGIGSPLAGALAWRGVAQWWLGRDGWRQDLDDALMLARSSNPATLTVVVAWTYGLGIQYGVLRADESALRASEQGVSTAAGSSNDLVLTLAKYALGVALLHQVAAADRHRGLELMQEALAACLRERVLFLVPVTEVWIARERAARGDLDAAIPVIRTAVQEMHRAGGLGYGLWGFRVHVETLLERGTDGDLTEAQQAIDRLASLSDDGSAMREITLLRLRALLARSRGDDVAYPDLVTRYRAMAESVGFEGHIDWSEAMTART
jgi:class 3 adenylate cyclase